MAATRKTLREMRLDKRLTQAEVALKMKISQAYYSAIECGKKQGEVADAMKTINLMRARKDRTDGGEKKAGRQKQ